MLSISLISFGIIIILIGVWYKFFKPVLKALTIHIDEKTSHTRTDICKIIITLSTASIVLTINFIKGGFSDINFLKASWLGFLISIALSILVLLLQYIKNLTNQLIVESEKNNEKWSKNLDKLMNNSSTIESLIFAFFYGEIAVLLGALLSLSLFGIKNL